MLLMTRMEVTLLLSPAFARRLFISVSPIVYSLREPSSLFVALFPLLWQRFGVEPIVASQWDRAGEGNGLWEKRKHIVC